MYVITSSDLGQFHTFRIPETYTTVKKNAVTNLAIYADGLWRLIEKPEDPDLVTQNTRLSFQLDKKLEERVRGFKPSRSPARSPARSSPKILKVQANQSNGHEQIPLLVKTDTSEPNPTLSFKTEKEPLVEKEVEPVIVKTEKGIDSNGGDLPEKMVVHHPLFFLECFQLIIFSF